MTRRSVIALGAVAALLSVVVASAATLNVSPGHLAVFTFIVEIPSPTPSPTPHGQAGTSIAAEKTAEGYVENGAGVDRFGVAGQVCVTNTGELPTESLRIVDQVQFKADGGPFADLPGAAQTIEPDSPLLPGESRCYAYRIEFTPIDGARYRNFARVTITNHSGWLPGGPHCDGPDPCPFGPEPKVDFDLPNPPLPLDPVSPPAEPEPTEIETPTPPPSDVLPLVPSL